MSAIVYRFTDHYNSFFVGVLRFFHHILLFLLGVHSVKCAGTIPLQGPLLIASHHEKLADQYIIGFQIRRKLFLIADITSPDSKKSLADSHFMKWIMLRIGAIPIDKRNPARNKDLFPYLLFLLKQGNAIVFFPESYLRSERKGRFGDFKDGVVRLAIAYKKETRKKLPIYPVGLSYKGKKATMKVGNPIYAAHLSERKRVFEAIKELS